MSKFDVLLDQDFEPEHTSKKLTPKQRYALLDNMLNIMPEVAEAIDIIGSAHEDVLFEPNSDTWIFNLVDGSTRAPVSVFEQGGIEFISHMTEGETINNRAEEWEIANIASALSLRCRFRNVIRVQVGDIIVLSGLAGTEIYIISSVREYSSCQATMSRVEL